MPAAQFSQATVNVVEEPWYWPVGHWAQLAVVLPPYAYPAGQNLHVADAAVLWS